MAKEEGVEGSATAAADEALAASVSEDEWREQEKKALKLRKEELKVRALNRNGRVDYTIQE